MDSNRRFRLMMLNDVHLPGPGYAGPGYPGAEARAEWAAQCACGGHGFEPVEFVIGVGDLIHGQKPGFTDELQDRGANIHGQPRHEMDYTDARHPDHESYLRGNPEERSFSILLEDNRRPAVTTDMGLEIVGDGV